MTEDISLKIKYWGVRGSVPSPLTSEQVRKKQVALVKDMLDKRIEERLSRAINMSDDLFLENLNKYLDDLPPAVTGTYGGNTTCLEVQAKDSPLIMLDAGTGARDFGSALLGRLFSGKNLNPLNSDEETKKDMHLFFTHYHWDHIQGFPFFAPGFIPGDNRVNIQFYGKADARQRLSEVLTGQQRFPNFPIEWRDMACVVDDDQYHELGRMTPSPIKIGKATVSYVELDHPDRVFAYSIEVNGKKFVFATDTEHRDNPDPDLVKLAKDADIMYYDAQYLPEEYVGKTGMHRFRWGHSTYEWAIKTAVAAGVKKAVVLGHHDPTRDDFSMDQLLERAYEYRDAHANPDLAIFAAEEGTEHKI